jgi:hypothetical protein
MLVGGFQVKFVEQFRVSVLVVLLVLSTNDWFLHVNSVTLPRDLSPIFEIKKSEESIIAFGIELHLVG